MSINRINNHPEMVENGETWEECRARSANDIDHGSYEEFCKWEDEMRAGRTGVTFGMDHMGKPDPNRLRPKQSMRRYVLNLCSQFKASCLRFVAKGRTRQDKSKHSSID